MTRLKYASGTKGDAPGSVWSSGWPSTHSWRGWLRILWRSRERTAILDELCCLAFPTRSISALKRKTLSFWRSTGGSINLIGRLGRSLVALVRSTDGHAALTTRWSQSAPSDIGRAAAQRERCRCFNIEI